MTYIAIIPFILFLLYAMEFFAYIISPDKVLDERLEKYARR